MMTILFAFVLTLLFMKWFRAKYDTWKIGNPVLFVFMMVLVIYAGLLFGQVVGFARSCWGVPRLQYLVHVEAFQDGIWGDSHLKFLFVAMALTVVFSTVIIWLTNQLARIKPLKRFLAVGTATTIRFITIIFFTALIGSNLLTAGVPMPKVEGIFFSAVRACMTKTSQETEQFSKDFGASVENQQLNLPDNINPEQLKLQYQHK